jgi:hypothetical protein
MYLHLRLSVYLLSNRAVLGRTLEPSPTPRAAPCGSGYLL